MPASDSTVNYWSAYGGRSATMWSADKFSGIGLRGISGGKSGTQVTASAQHAYAWSINACVPDHNAIPILAFDGLGEISIWSTYRLGNLAARQKKTVTYLYTRM